MRLQLLPEDEAKLKRLRFSMRIAAMASLIFGLIAIGGSVRCIPVLQMDLVGLINLAFLVAWAVVGIAAAFVYMWRRS